MHNKFKYLGLAILLAASSITAQAECIREKGGGGEIGLGVGLRRWSGEGTACTNRSNAITGSG